MTDFLRADFLPPQTAAAHARPGMALKTVRRRARDGDHPRFCWRSRPGPAAGDPLPVHRRHLERARRRRLPRAGRRGVLGLYRREIAVLFLRRLSARLLLAGEPHLCARGGADRLAAAPKNSGQGDRARRLLPRPSHRRLCPAPWRARARLARGRHKSVGRGAGVADHGAGRHGGGAAGRRGSGDGAALGTSGAALVVRGDNRIRARRAADRGAVHGQRPAAAVPAAGLGAGSAAAPHVRHRAVRLGLYGGGGARRARGRAARAGGGGGRARFFALAVAEADRAAAGAWRGGAGHRQQFRRPVQGHDAGRHRRPVRLPARHRRGASRSGLGGAGPSRSPATFSPRCFI